MPCTDSATNGRFSVDSFASTNRTSRRVISSTRATATDLFNSILQKGASASTLCHEGCCCACSTPTSNKYHTKQCIATQHGTHALEHCDKKLHREFEQLCLISRLEPVRPGGGDSTSGGDDAAARVAGDGERTTGESILK